MSRSSRYFNKVKIRRDHLAEDGFRQLNDLGPYMKGTIYIKFYDEWVCHVAACNTVIFLRKGIGVVES